jgi:hypothetical protein
LRCITQQLNHHCTSQASADKIRAAAKEVIETSLIHKVLQLEQKTAALKAQLANSSVDNSPRVSSLARAFGLKSRPGTACHRKKNLAESLLFLKMQSNCNAPFQQLEEGLLLQLGPCLPHVDSEEAHIHSLHE